MNLNYDEVSVYFGVILLATGASMWILQYTHQVFINWGWSIFYGSVFVILGYLLFYSDVRVYIGDRTVTEEFISNN